MRQINQISWFSLLSIVVVMLLAGCNDTDGKDRNIVRPSPAKERKQIWVRDWIKVNPGDKFKPTNNKINGISASHNGKSLYVRASDGAELFFADLTAGFDKLFNDASWERISLATTNLDGSQGKAEMANAVIANAFVPTKEGVLVERSVAGKAANVANGVALLKGNTWQAAWSHENANMHFPVDATNRVVSAGVLTKGAKQYPVIFQTGSSLAFSSDTAADFAQAKLSVGVKSHTANTFTAPLHVVPYKDSGIFVDAVGVHTLKPAHIGTAAADWVTEGSINAATPIFGSDAWRFAAGAAVNNQVNAVAVSGNYLFIALRSNGATDNTGGVAVIHLTTPSVRAPDVSWSKVNVISLATDEEGTVWAVTSKGLFIAQTNGKKGTALSALALPEKVADIKENKVYDKDEKLLPTKNITGATFVNGNLIIATSDQGLIVRKAGVTRFVKIKKDQSS